MVWYGIMNATEDDVLHPEDLLHGIIMVLSWYYHGNSMVWYGMVSLMRLRTMFCIPRICCMVLAWYHHDIIIVIVL